MGASGPGTFENDQALDWLAEFQDAPNAKTIAAALRRVSAAGGKYLEVDDPAAALAAAEVVAAINGHAAADLPEEIAVGIAGIKVSAERTTLAIASVERVLEKSELQELWKESDAYKKWRSILRGLITRLQKAPRAPTKRVAASKPRAEPAISIREVLSVPAPTGGWVLSVTEIESGEQASTQAAMKYPGGGAGVWAGVGKNLGVTARWRSARHLEISVPRKVVAFQAQPSVQHLATVVKVTYREFE